MRTMSIDEWVAKLERASSRSLPGEIRKAMIIGALTAERRSKTQATSAPRARTGHLRRSIKAVARGVGLDSEIRLSANTPYAGVQEHGGTILPKKGKYLTIPLGAAKTAAGVSRKGARDYPDLFFIMSKAGKPLLVRKSGDGIEPMFLLVTSSRVPARPYLAPGIEAARKDLPFLIGAAFRRAVSIDG